MIYLAAVFVLAVVGAVLRRARRSRLEKGLGFDAGWLGGHEQGPGEGDAVDKERVREVSEAWASAQKRRVDGSCMPTWTVPRRAKLETFGTLQVRYLVRISDLNSCGSEAWAIPIGGRLEIFSAELDGVELNNVEQHEVAAQPFDPTGFADRILGGLRTAPSSESPAEPPRHWTDLVEEVVRYGFHYVDLRFTHDEISSCRFKGPDGIIRHEYHSTLSMQEAVERCYAAWKAEK